MADVDNCSGIACQRRSGPSSLLQTSADGKGSSNMMDAMDSIFPKSPSEFLQNPDRHVISTLPSILNVNQALACTVSNAHITTNTTTTATAVFTGLSTSASGTKSPIMSSIPTYSIHVPSLPASAIVGNSVGEQKKSICEQKNSVCEQNGNSLCKPKQLCKSRVSRVDLEICGQTILDSPRSTILEKFCSDSSELCPESEQVEALDGKKLKKRCRKDKERKLMEDDLQSGETITIAGKNFSQESGMGQILDAEEVGSSDNNSTPGVNVIANAANGYDSSPSHSQLNSLTNGDLSVSQEFIVYPLSIKVKQKLPKIKRQYIHITKDGKYLRKKFLPCFVVLKNADTLLSGFESPLHLSMSLSERVKHLSELCSEEKIVCPKALKQKEVIWKKRMILDDSMLEVKSNSEDEFVNPRGRSLRKRNHNVCYVEPSEDDLLEEFTFSKKKKSQCADASPEVNAMKNNKDPDDQSPLVDKDVSKTSVEDSVSIAVEKTVLNKEPSISVPNEKHNKPEKLIEKDSCEKKEKHKKRKSIERTAEKEAHGNLDKTKSSQGKAVDPPSLSQLNQPVTSSSQLKDKEGRSLVYVYPKTSIVNKGKSTDSISDSSKLAKVNRPGPASKTRQPVAPVTTLSLPRSLLGISGNLVSQSGGNTTLSQQTPTILQPPVSGATTSPQFYMMKIDGKDYLVPILTGTSNVRPRTTSSTVTLPSNALQPGGSCRLLYQPAPGFPNSQTVLSRASVASLAQPFAGTRFSTIMMPGVPASSGIRMLSTSLSPNNVLSTIPLIGSPQVATTCIPVTTLSQTSISNRPPQLIPSSIVTTTALSLPSGSTSLVSLVHASLASIAVTTIAPSSQSIIMATRNTTSGTMLASGTVAPLAAPASTTVLRSSRPRTGTTAVTPATQLVASNSTATGTRCFRIIVPACGATGTPARIATLGPGLNSSPLTHMSISSTLLPQRKRSVDKEMSPEKIAAKRRRLEKKYPLPPGVVIKTEPLDTPQPVTTVQSGTVRSLLGQNIQLITGSRSGSNTVQNIRIISPPIGTRQMRLAPNVIIRAPAVSSVNGPTGTISPLPAVTTGSRPGLVLVAPSSQATTLLSSSAVSSSQVINNVTGSITTTTITSTTTASANIPVVVSSTADVSLTTTVSNVSASTMITGNVTSVSSLHSNSSTSSGVASDKITTLSYSTSSTCPSIVANAAAVVSVSSKDKSLIACAQTTVSAMNKQTNSLDSMKDSVETLQKIIDAQEQLGVKGPRLDKLKELLAQKISALGQLQREQDEEPTTEASENSSSLEDASVSQGVNPSDPVVIE